MRGIATVDRIPTGEDLVAIWLTSRTTQESLETTHGNAVVTDLTNDPDATNRLVSAATRSVGLPADVRSRLRQVDALLGSQVVESLSTLDEAATIEAALAPGARVCFTGTARSTEGRVIERSELKGLAESHDLLPVDTVTKTRCDALVVAELGTQSGKARKAVEYGKPVFSAEEFLAWLARQ